MSGNLNKLARNKKHLARSSRGGISDQVKIATDLEEAAWAMNNIAWRKKRERREKSLAKRNKVTLPSFKFMEKP